jgi:hypothetical protein
MSTGEKRTSSFVDRLMSSRRHRWIRVGIGVFLIVAPIGMALLDGVLLDFFSHGFWRLALFPAAVIIYILVLSPILSGGEERVIQAVRPLVLMDDDSFSQLVNEASRVNPIGEVTAFAVGGAFGLWVGQSWLSDANVFWLRLYLSLSAGLMFGLLGWVIYSSVASTRLTSELHRQPLRIDILDTKPFEPIGRQSLIIALAFVGGIALSIVFGLGLGSILAWQNWLIYLLLAVVPILVFFLNMRDTHRVLAAEKRRELEAVQRNILLACRTLMKRIAADERTGTLAAEINALVAYEERLQAARTWPYNTAMLRTLFVSIIIPGGAALAQALSEILFE